jgi:hypothetical protein
MSRLIAASATRRRGLAAAAGALVGGIAATVDADPAPRRRPRPEGPCGDGSGPDNRCKKNKECCTGICNKEVRRCRCLRRGEACSSDKNCCGASRCKKGVCGSGPAPGGCTVCASGCEYSTIQDAIDAAASGAVIGIGEKTGGYPENVMIAKSLTLEACNGTPVINPTSGNGIEFAFSGGENREIVLSGLTLQGSGVDGCGIRVGTFAINPGGDFAVTLSDLTVQGWGNPVGTDSYAGGVFLAVSGSLTVQGGTYRNNSQNLEIVQGTLRPLTVSITGATLDGGGGAGDRTRGSLFLTGFDMTATVTDTTISNYNGYFGGMFVDSAQVTLAGSTAITGNTSALMGGGILADWGAVGTPKPTSLTIESTVRISGNTAPIGSGIAANGYAIGRITGADDTTVAPNGNGDQCQTTTNFVSPVTVPNCAFA